MIRIASPSGACVAVAVAIALSAAACQSPTYGGRPIAVTLTTVAQSEGGPVEAATADALAATVYLPNLDQWIDLEGEERMAEILRLERRGETEAARRARDELIDSLMPYRRNGSTPLRVSLQPRRHVLVAERGDVLRHMAFDPLRQRVVEIDLE